MTESRTVGTKFISLISNSCFFIIFYLVYFLIRILTFLFLLINIKEWYPKKKNSVLFLEIFPIENAGYQYRSKKWSDVLEDNGFYVKVKTTIKSKRYYEKLLSKSVVLYYILTLYIRFFQILGSINYETIIVRREILQYNDYGNLFLEKLLKSISVNVILDFDDDIAWSKGEPRKINNFYGKIMLENGRKFEQSLKLYSEFIVGSNYLRDLVLKTNVSAIEKDICVIPTCVDYQKYNAKQYKIKQNDVISLGWIGSNNNLKLLKAIIPDLNQLNKIYPIKLIIIGGGKEFPKVDFEVQNLKWSFKTQTDNMLMIDIGLMPLDNTLESKGKCGFKLIQYMGLGIVSVANAVTINTEIVHDGEDGFLVDIIKNNWKERLISIIDNKKNFEKIGKQARLKINNFYSYNANKKKMIAFINTKNN